jgi:hypothetical protein
MVVHTTSYTLASGIYILHAMYLTLSHLVPTCGMSLCSRALIPGVTVVSGSLYSLIVLAMVMRGCRVGAGTGAVDPKVSSHILTSCPDQDAYNPDHIDDLEDSTFAE